MGPDCLVMAQIGQLWANPSPLRSHCRHLYEGTPIQLWEVAGGPANPMGSVSCGVTVWEEFELMTGEGQTLS